MDSLTLVLTFPVVEGEPVIDPVRLHMTGRDEADLAEYSRTMLRALRRGDWTAEILRPVHDA